MTLKKIKPTRGIFTNPEVIAAILYGMGVNPAIKINKYPYSFIDFENNPGFHRIKNKHGKQFWSCILGNIWLKRE